MNGTLALVGSGEYLPGMDVVDRMLLAGLPSPAKVVCLPTGAGTEGPDRIAYWSELGVSHFNVLGANAQAVDVIDRETALRQDYARTIRDADLVYFSGGKPPYLHQVLEDSPVWESVLSVLQKGGVVAGCSAGAMIFGSEMPRFPLFGTRSSGFGVLADTVIIPHFDEIPSALVNLARPFAQTGSIVGIEGFTALVCRADGFSVSGSGGVTLWNHNSKRRFTANDGSLPTFTRLELPTHTHH